MGNQLMSYPGAVVFIDLLGFGALTKGQIKLEKNDIEPWTKQFNHPLDHHYLAANILVKFREILSNLEPFYANVKIAQLSDCFFAWSESPNSIVKFTNHFMWQAIESGILCRGGMSYGSIIETQSNHQFGRLILGDAVTKAAGLEGLAKGTRILTEPDFVNAMFNENQDDHNKLNELIKQFENPLDFEIYDEYKWYLVKDLNSISKFGPSYNTLEERINMTKHRLKLSNVILYSPLFSWNSKSQQGLVQLKATNNILSEDGLLGIYHDFSRRGISEKSRSSEILATSNETVDNDAFSAEPFELV